jgi:predicted amidohydrolase YtcJ
MFFKGTHSLPNLYDSHVHWLYTGQVAHTWNLKDIKNPQEILQAELKPEYFRGHWITGFGWDENNWPRDFKIHRKFLDRLSLDRPIQLSRTDGHSSWVNTKALSELGFLDKNSEQYKKFASDIELDETGTPSGVLRESAHMHCIFGLPDISLEQKKKFLFEAAKMFNRAGFTHIRDMTSDLSQWELSLELAKDPEFILHAEQWFVCESVQNLSRQIEQLKKCKTQENEWMKIRGLKVFVDGSLGSETACLSHPYSGQIHSGKMIWSESDVKTILRECWKNNFDVALHSIGDETSHQIVNWARQVYAEGIQGYLHLEHVEILRPETIQNMKSIHVRCHLQPCHWWGDQKWLKEKVGDLFSSSFPWESLRKAQIPISFGSDAPIEASNFFSNLSALEDSAKAGIRKLGVPGQAFHSYPGKDSVSGMTIIQDDQIHSVELGSRKIVFT